MARAFHPRCRWLGHFTHDVDGSGISPTMSMARAFHPRCRWLGHFTHDVDGSGISPTISMVRAFHPRCRWPGRTTRTSYALSGAVAETLQGRPDVHFIVVVITDGKLMCPSETS